MHSAFFHFYYFCMGSKAIHSLLHCVGYVYIRCYSYHNTHSDHSTSIWFTFLKWKSFGSRCHISSPLPCNLISDWIKLIDWHVVGTALESWEWKIMEKVDFGQVWVQWSIYLTSCKYIVNKGLYLELIHYVKCSLTYTSWRTSTNN